MPAEGFFDMRDRAHALADSGQYKDWMQIAAKLRSEGFGEGLVERLDGDRLAVMMLTRCCLLARTAQ